MEPGLPDINGCLAPTGRTLVIETKVPGKVPEPLQYERLREYERAGAIAFWCDSFEDYEAKIKAFL